MTNWSCPFYLFIKAAEKNEQQSQKTEKIVFENYKNREEKEREREIGSSNKQGYLQHQRRKCP